VPLRTVTRALGLTAALVVTAACSDDGPSASTSTDPSTTTETTVPERPASTTTTAFDPASVEGEVEAAYLASWDVYADAVYDLELDEQALAKVYGGEHLQTKTDEITDRIADGRAALVDVEHDYEVQMVDETTAVLVDEFVNHQVLIDPETKEPIEEDPNESGADAVSLKQSGGVWRVTRVVQIA
jgi:hypothetical protein